MLGLTATLLSLLTLILFGEIQVAGRCEIRSLTLRIPSDHSLKLAHAEAVIRGAGGPTVIESIRDVNGTSEIAFRYCARHLEHSAFLGDLVQAQSL